ncbi:MAG: prepilin-type N-terminal cleavage/methylation domain-containing protein [Cyanobacteria bacterium SIG30]|nr:prepilin-type N-terminal cleavage/methylation domain-containing protein [Cyanobacteria bacterium SIG30]
MFLTSQKYGHKSLKAFTLAEVLITLAIIGVVAAITIPTTIKNHWHTEISTGAKTSFSIMSNVIRKAVYDHGPTDTWDIGITGNIDNAEDFIEKYILPYVKIAKNCKRSKTQDCYYKIYNLKGEVFDWNSTDDYPKEFARFYLANGTAITFFLGGHIGTKTREVQLFTDFNGWRGPNKMGIDVQTYFINLHLEDEDYDPKNRFRLSLPYEGESKKAKSLITNQYRGCSKSAGIYAGMWCTSLMYLYNNGRVPSKEQYVKWAENKDYAKNYPW